MKRLCSIPGCGKPVDHHGWCTAHYKRWYRHGDPLGGGPAYGHAKAFLEAALTSDTDECILWPYACSGDGYGRINIGKRILKVSRVVCAHIHGGPPSLKHEVAHNCGVKLCINPRHLRWATRSENMFDKRDHGTMHAGATHSWAHLSDATIIAICRATGTGRAIAQRFNVSEAYVSQLRSGTHSRLAYIVLAPEE